MPVSVIYVKLSQPQKEHLETTILVWFGLFVFKNCFYRLASCRNSEYQVRVVSGCQHLQGSWPAWAPLSLFPECASRTSPPRGSGKRAASRVVACAAKVGKDFTLIKRPPGIIQAFIPQKASWGLSLKEKGLFPHHFSLLNTLEQGETSFQGIVGRIL